MICFDENGNFNPNEASIQKLIKEIYPDIQEEELTNRVSEFIVNCENEININKNYKFLKSLIDPSFDFDYNILKVIFDGIEKGKINKPKTFKKLLLEILINAYLISNKSGNFKSLDENEVFKFIISYTIFLRDETVGSPSSQKSVENLFRDESYTNDQCSRIFKGRNTQNKTKTLMEIKNEYNENFDKQKKSLNTVLNERKKIFSILNKLYQESLEPYNELKSLEDKNHLFKMFQIVSFYLDKEKNKEYEIDSNFKSKKNEVETLLQNLGVVFYKKLEIKIDFLGVSTNTKDNTKAEIYNNNFYNFCFFPYKLILESIEQKDLKFEDEILFNLFLLENSNGGTYDEILINYIFNQNYLDVLTTTTISYGDGDESSIYANDYFDGEFRSNFKNIQLGIPKELDTKILDFLKPEPDLYTKFISIMEGLGFDEITFINLLKSRDTNKLVSVFTAPYLNQLQKIIDDLLIVSKMKSTKSLVDYVTNIFKGGTLTTLSSLVPSTGLTLGAFGAAMNSFGKLSSVSQKGDQPLKYTSVLALGVAQLGINKFYSGINLELSKVKEFTQEFEKFSKNENFKDNFYDYNDFISYIKSIPDLLESYFNMLYEIYKGMLDEFMSAKSSSTEVALYKPSQPILDTLVNTIITINVKSLSQNSLNDLKLDDNSKKIETINSILKENPAVSSALRIKSLEKMFSTELSIIPGQEVVNQTPVTHNTTLLNNTVAIKLAEQEHLRTSQLMETKYIQQLDEFLVHLQKTQDLNASLRSILKMHKSDNFLLKYFIGVHPPMADIPKELFKDLKNNIMCPVEINNDEQLIQRLRLKTAIFEPEYDPDPSITITEYPDIDNPNDIYGWKTLFGTSAATGASIPWFLSTLNSVQVMLPYSSSSSVALQGLGKFGMFFRSDFLSWFWTFYISNARPPMILRSGKQLRGGLLRRNKTKKRKNRFNKSSKKGGNYTRSLVKSKKRNSISHKNKSKRNKNKIRSKRR